MSSSPDTSEGPSTPSLGNRKLIKCPCPSDVSVISAFSVVSYNILADCHTKPSYYPYRDPKYLEQDSRHGVLMAELKALDADIFCLQEVGSTYYAEKLEPEMRKYE